MRHLAGHEPLQQVRDDLTNVTRSGYARPERTADFHLLVTGYRVKNERTGFELPGRLHLY
ncbi:MAG: hypothetical protein ACYDHP_03485 [Ferrimicrobium sp.]